MESFIRWHVIGTHYESPRNYNFQRPSSKIQRSKAVIDKCCFKICYAVRKTYSYSLSLTQSAQSLDDPNTNNRTDKTITNISWSKILKKIKHDSGQRKYKRMYFSRNNKWRYKLASKSWNFNVAAWLVKGICKFICLGLD